MSVFHDGYCEKCNGSGIAVYYKYHYDKKTKTDHEESFEETCHDCLGTTLKLSSLGLDLVEFLRDIGVTRE